MTRSAGRAEKGAALSGAVGVLSLLPTPLVVLVSTASALYLENQDAFQHQSGVMLPFVWASLGTMAIGALLCLTSGNRLSRWLMWAYYMAAPFFLLFSFLQDWSLGSHFFLWVFGTWPGVVALAATFLLATTLVASRFDHQKARLPLAAFGLLLLLTEGVTFANRLEPRTATGSRQTPGAGLEFRDDLPNIYHVIFDGYDASDFPKTLDEASRSALSGFVSFPGDEAIYRSTRMSLPSIFSGRRKAPDESPEEYMERAFNSRESLLYWLRRDGYRTLGYVPKVYDFDLGLFDRVIYDRDNLDPDALLAMNTASFERLWLFLNTPRLVTRRLLETGWFARFGGEGLAQVRDGTHLPFSVPVTSYFSFLSFLEQEARLPDRGRYTLVHLVIPHRPEVLASDCSYDEGGRATTRMEQARCATRLLVALVERLRDLGRLDDSLVIVHSDHGAWDEESDLGAHDSERVSLRALLLIKPIGRQGDMSASEAATTLLDIAPTMLDAAGVEHDLRSEGSSLLQRPGGPGP